MSAFKKRLRTFKSDITGEEKEYKVNTAVWLYLEEDFGITQGNLDKENDKSYLLTAAKAAVCIFKANKIETTLQEVLENTNEIELLKFVTSFNTAMVSEDDDASKKAETKGNEGKPKK